MSGFLRPADKPGDAKRGGPAETSEPIGQELLYAAHIALDRTQMQIEDELVIRHAGDGGDQDGETARDRISAVGAVALQTGKLARALRGN